MFNDAFASLWGKGFQTPPAGDTSAPVQNSVYRDDLGKIADEGFNLVRVYNWGIARGTTADQAPNYAGLDHVNFLNYAKTLGLTVVVPVSDYFLTNDAFAWNNTTPNASYDFSSATSDIQSDLNQFIASITDPSTGKIFTNVQISVGNEGDIGEGGVYQANNSPPNTNASDYLARTIWWIKNLHDKINGAGGVNGPSGDIVPITATFSNSDQGATQADPTHPGKWGSWMNWVVSGVEAGQHAPVGWNLSNFNPADQALSAVNEAKTIENYLALHNADTAHSTTNVIGYNYFEFNDEPAAGKFVGLYQYGTAFQNAQTGTSSLFYDPRGGYPTLIANHA